MNVIELSFLITGSALLAAILLWQLPNLIFACQLFVWTIRTFASKNNFEPLVSEQIEPWPEPVSREQLFASLESKEGDQTQPKESKIIWGYWHQGEDKLPGFGEMAVQSWRLRHPNWHIIIVSEDNYKKYLSHTDIPSTFNSLKIQSRSDFVRAAVLRRYGGVYLDISYVLLKGFDNMWDSAEKNGDVYLTSIWTLEDKGRDMIFPNACLLVSPTPQNPLITAWHNALLEYFEAPSYTVEEMKQNPVLAGASKFVDHPSLWYFKRMSPYFGSLWVLMETMYYNPTVGDYAKDHVYILPTLLWTVDQLMAPLFTTPETEIHFLAHRKESIGVWISRFPNAIKMIFRDDSTAASKFITHANAVKVSTDFSPHFTAPPEYHLSLQSTQGRIWRAALDKTTPTEQASTKGAYNIVPIVSKIEDTEDVELGFNSATKPSAKGLLIPTKTTRANSETSESSLCSTRSSTNSPIVAN